MSMQALGRPGCRSNKLHPGRLGGPTRYRGIHAGDDRGWAAPEPQPHCIPPVLRLLQKYFFFFLKVCLGGGRQYLNTRHNQTGSFFVVRKQEPLRMASHSLIEPNAWVMARLPNGTTRLLQMIPNTQVYQLLSGWRSSRF